MTRYVALSDTSVHAMEILGSSGESPTVYPGYQYLYIERVLINAMLIYVGIRGRAPGVHMEWALCTVQCVDH
jgi:hypothetical protein